MSAKRSKIITCDRCGKLVYFNFDEYEPKPDGWKHGFDLDLCPDCYKEYLKLKKSFLLNEPSETELAEENDEVQKWLLDSAEIFSKYPDIAKNANDWLNQKFMFREALNIAIKKLAAYEDTGYEPKEITTLHDDYLDIDNCLRTANTEIKRLRRLLKMTNDILLDEQIEWDYADEVEEVLNNG